MECVVELRDAERLNVLRSHAILDTPREESFDRLTRVARELLQVPIALISLVDQNRQWFKSKQGIEVHETPRSSSFCAHAIRQDQPYLVGDATQHSIFRNNPLVTGAPFIRFYAGIPLVVDGEKLGTFCVIDTKPRELSPEQLQSLCDLAAATLDLLELRRIAVKDVLTGSLTKLGFEQQMSQEVARHNRNGRALSYIAIDVDTFEAVNETFGRAAGDTVLREVAAQVRQGLRPSDLVGRMGGDEFAVCLPETDQDGALNVAERIRSGIERASIHKGDNRIHVTASLGVSSFALREQTWVLASARANLALDAARRAGGNTIKAEACPLVTPKHGFSRLRRIS